MWPVLGDHTRLLHKMLDPDKGQIVLNDGKIRGTPILKMPPLFVFFTCFVAYDVLMLAFCLPYQCCKDRKRHLEEKKEEEDEI